MYLYQAYGLQIGSVLPLPELVAGESTAVPDVIIRLAAVPRPAQWDDVTDQPEAGRQIVISPNDITLYWADVGAFRILGGREICLDPLPGVPEPVLRLFVLGTTLAMLLHQRGETAVFHASVVAVDGQAVGFVGAKGAGKSTLAALFHSRGHTLIADDILAVDMRPSPPVVRPGFPHLKLWPDAVAALGYAADAWPKLRPEVEKRGYRPMANVEQMGFPLQGIYVLAYGETVALSRLPAKEALMVLLPHWYGARFGQELLTALGAARHFQECLTLVNRVPVYRLQRPFSLSDLPQVAGLIESEIGERGR